MAILQAIMAFLTRQVGKVLNTSLGWATIMLFGKVPQKRQYLLTGMSFGSVAWIVILLGIVFPKIGSFLLAFALPSDEYAGVIRLAMLGAALVLPAIVGVAALFVTDKAQRPHGMKETMKVIGRGYPYTLGLAVTLVMMTVFAPILKAHDIIRRRTSDHVPVVIEPDDYEGVAAAVQRVLQEHGFPTQRAAASWMLRVPTKVLTLLARSAVSGLVTAEVTKLASDRLEVELHPSDLVVHGKQKDVMRVRAVLSEYLVFTEAHLTWTKEAQAFEDQLRDIWKALRGDITRAAALARLEMLAKELRRAELDYEEWQVVFRAKLLVEEALLARREPTPEGLPAARAPSTGAAPRPVPRDRVLTTGLALLLAALSARRARPLLQ